MPQTETPPSEVEAFLAAIEEDLATTIAALHVAVQSVGSIDKDRKEDEEEEESGGGREGGGGVLTRVGERLMALYGEMKALDPLNVPFDFKLEARKRREGVGEGWPAGRLEEEVLKKVERGNEIKKDLRTLLELMVGGRSVVVSTWAGRLREKYGVEKEEEGEEEEEGEKGEEEWSGSRCSSVIEEEEEEEVDLSAYLSPVVAPRQQVKKKERGDQFALDDLWGGEEEVVRTRAARRWEEEEGEEEDEEGEEEDMEEAGLSAFLEEEEDEEMEEEEEDEEEEEEEEEDCHHDRRHRHSRAGHGREGEEEEEEEGDEEEEEEEEEVLWTEGFDEHYRAFFYFNERTGKSQWHKPKASYVAYDEGESEDEEGREEEGE